VFLDRGALFLMPDSYPVITHKNNEFSENGIKMVSGKFPDTEKVVVWTAFFMNFLCFYGFQASKQAILRWFSPTFDIHLNLIELFPLNNDFLQVK
jgi:hypothetical protein